MPETQKFDVVVIGGGLIGCFAALNLRRYELNVALVEAREDLCTGVSRANTAAIYSGYDTKPGTLKTRLCVEGAKDYESLCARLGVRYKKCGSIMVCFGERGAVALRDKYRRGLENGVEGLRLLDKKQVLAMEPGLSGDIYMGLYAPGAGTVNPWELGIAAGECFVKNGGQVYFQSPVSSAQRTKTGYALQAGARRIEAAGVINCAGLFADEVRELIKEPEVRIFPDKCDYLVLDSTQSGLVSHVIFYEPEEKGKGITIVPTVDGNVLLGGSVAESADKLSNTTTAAGMEKVLSAAERLLPGLPRQSVIRSFAAVRPNPWRVAPDENGGFAKDGGSINDFVIDQSDRFISFIGIKTPGLTCADGLGRLAADKMAAVLGVARQNASWDPTLPEVERFAAASRERRAEFIRADSAYGRIVCHCRSVTEAEIVESIRRGAVTLDGVKRRTGAGMGRCQGAGCSMRIIELLARELGISVSQVLKDGNGSGMIYER